MKLLMIAVLVIVQILTAGWSDDARLGGSPSDDWTFVNCLENSGPGMPVERGCEGYDRDLDLDIDLWDYAEVQRDIAFWP